MFSAIQCPLLFSVLNILMSCGRFSLLLEFCAFVSVQARVHSRSGLAWEKCPISPLSLEAKTHLCPALR